MFSHLFNCGEFTPGTPLYLQIVQRIRQAIATGAIAPDTSLPSERELAISFGVSRIPVREALKILEFLGVVEQVRGKGVVVRTVDMGAMLDIIDFAVTDPLKTLTDLFETREALEVMAANLAASRATPKDLESMERSIVQMEVEIRMSLSVTDASKNFHFAMVQASHNTLLIRMYNCLYNMLEYSRSRSLRTYSRHSSVLRNHRTIFEHIRRGDGVAAAEAMRGHLRSALRSIEDQIAIQNRIQPETDTPKIL
ncbi:MAG: FadR/GntR family transcriptional regulator [Desulfovibrionaceae bacterium]